MPSQVEVTENPTRSTVREVATLSRWNLIQRIAVRFFFSYFILFFMTDPMIAVYLPFLGPVMKQCVAFWSPIVTWVGTQVLHTRYDIQQPEGLGGVSNTAYGLILCLCYVALAAVVTILWSVLDRKRVRYVRLYPWFRLLLRFTLALTMINYGVIKVIPSQMTAPLPLAYLTERVGDLTPMRMLWMFIGSSPPYEIFTGCAELLGGLLLLLPRTTLLGALVCCADMTMVFVLNMAYDVQVKLFSFHLLMMAVLLAAPDLPRLADLFLFNRGVEPAETSPLSNRRWLDRAAQAFVLLFGLYAIGIKSETAYMRYKKTHPPRPPWYGVWNVESFTIDGREVPLFTDPQRWRSMMFHSPGRVGVELMIGSYKSYALALDGKGRTMRLRELRAEPGGQAVFSFAEPEEDVLLLNGQLDGHPAQARIRKMALISQRFHWVFVPPKEE